MYACVCEQCGETFEKRNKQRFCTHACYAKSITQLPPEQTSHWKGGGTTKECVQCGLPFRVGSTQAARRRCCSKECYAKYMRQFTGDATPNWKGGVHPGNMIAREVSIYREWRTAVFERDDYTCQECKQRGMSIQAHHLYPFAQHQHLRLDVNNGVTLCKECHEAIRGKESEFLQRMGLDPVQPPLIWVR